MNATPHTPATAELLDAPLTLLGGLSRRQFMARQWQKKPLLVRAAWPGITPPLSRLQMIDLAGQDGVESRLIQASSALEKGASSYKKASTSTDDAAEGANARWVSGAGWKLTRGPFTRRQMPPMSHPGWTLLVQGLDLHHNGARAILDAFDFIPQARLDDLMASYASDGGGVGPHFDRYDVFLLQAQGKRRWQISAQKDLELVEGAPLKILRNFSPTDDWVLEPGDMLYLPPRYAHNGVAVGGDCITLSIGFRSPRRSELAHDLLLRLADAMAQDDESAEIRAHLYADPAQPAVPGQSALIPPAMYEFAQAALQHALADPQALALALGEVLTEPKPSVWFDAGPPLPPGRCALRLDRCTRMAVDTRHVFINGEGFVAAGKDARLLHTLAHARLLAVADAQRLSDEAWALVDEWAQAGWLHVRQEEDAA